MFEFDIVLLTEDRYCNPLVVNDYISNILEDDAILTKALEAKGYRVVRKSWSDNFFKWETSRFVIFRTTWDYFDRFKQFNKWLTATQHKTTFINSADLIKWNLDKHYLDYLKDKNIPTVATLFIDKGAQISLSAIYSELGAGEIVIKPVISGAARHTYRISEQQLPNHESIFQDLIANEDMMAQHFQESIITKGEIAFMVMNGKFTHAVLKKARQGDFRVQDDFGGTLHDYDPTTAEITFAEAAVKACPELPLYARVDVIHDNNGELAVMELELIEPELWFRRNPAAAAKLAGAIYEQNK